MRRLILSILLAGVFIFSGLPKQNALAEGEFITDASVVYKVLDTGKTHVTHEIVLENAFSTIYATSYTLTLENIESEEVSAYGSGGEKYVTEVIKEGEKTNIKILFPDSIVGKGAKRNFNISYLNGKFAVRTGEVWEISIPRLNAGNSFRSYSTKLLIPQSFGLEAYISPRPGEATTDEYGKIYKFSKEDLTTTGITAGFGQFQVFSFNLLYHLENPLAVPAETQIALPPDTAFQKVYLSRINPKPQNVEIDDDGNWLGVYKLGPRERLDVVVNGSVQIFASFRKFPKPGEDVLSANLKESEFWQVDDPEIKSIAAGLKTPEAIYKYVSENLKYDFGRVTPNVQRYGAIKALQNKEQAICMEFTDLFIALARAAGIPAREVNGFAYTENPELQPLSLVADVLHAWPEYYDKQKGVWIPVDPTWGATSGGVDYFNKLDLRHFSFVNHGTDALKPYPPGSYKLGANPQKDVFVSFGKLPEDRVSNPALTLLSKKTNLLFESSYKVKVENTGPAGLYSLYSTVYFDDKEESRDFIEALPPYSNYVFDISLPFSVLAADTPDNVLVSVEGSRINIPTNKTQMIIQSMVSIFAIFFTLIVLVLIKLKKITFAPLTGKIAKLYGKIFRKSSETSANP